METKETGKLINPYFVNPSPETLFYFETLLWGKIAELEIYLNLLSKRDFPDGKNFLDIEGISEKEFSCICDKVRELKRIVGDGALKAAMAYINRLNERGEIPGHLKTVTKVFNKE